MGSHGFPWVPMGPHGSPWGPMGSHGVPMASMENPRMSEIMDFNENHYSVRQKIGDPGSKSMRNVFPLHPVTPKRPESPYGAKKEKLAENPVFQFFGLEIPYRTRVGPYRITTKRKQETEPWPWAHVVANGLTPTLRLSLVS